MKAVWSELEEDLKMMEYMTNNLKACNLQVPPQKVMMRRATQQEEIH